MNAAIPRVRFKEFLRPNLRPVTLAPDQDANLVGMRWYGGGPFHRELKEAQKIRKKSHFVIKTGDVLYNKLFAWKGAFGIVPLELDGMFVSDKFPTYDADLNRIRPRFLAWYFRHHDVWDQARKKSTGSAAISKLTLNPSQFLELDIPLPRLGEQDRIISQLDMYAECIEEAKTLRASAVTQTRQIIDSTLNSLLAGVKADGQLRAVLTDPPRNGWSPKCDNLDAGTPVLSLAAVTGWHYDHREIKLTSIPTEKDRHYWLRPGDLLITRSNTPELVGHAAIYSGEPHPCIYPDLMMRLSIDSIKASTRFIWWWMQTRLVRSYIRKKAKGSSPTMKKISQSVVMEIPFPQSLPRPEQDALAGELDTLQAKIAIITEIQDETASPIGLVLPSILSRAFDGGRIFVDKEPTGRLT